MARKHRERYEYLKKKKAKQLAKIEASERKAMGIPEEKEPSGNFFRELLGWVLYVAIIIGVTYLIITYVGQRTRVSGESMEATLQNGDNLIVDKISYRFRDPERFEIIVFPYRYGENTYYIKRIIGMPGETVQVKEGYIYINGERLNEQYGLEVIDADKYGMAAEPIQLGEDEYFVMGDNRNHSSDSRAQDVGLISKEDMIGRAWVRIWPLDNFGVIPHE